MFSSGNITEKMRVARFDCSGQVVVDLYAGIGYYTLPYLVHAKGESLYLPNGMTYHCCVVVCTRWSFFAADIY